MSWRVHDYRRLDVWHEAIDLAVDVYRLTRALPDSERYGLVVQMHRSVVSISANIAEGAGRGTNGEMARFLRTALGSLSETESHIALARRLGFVAEDDSLDESIARIRGKIKGLHNHLLDVFD